MQSYTADGAQCSGPSVFLLGMMGEWGNLWFFLALFLLSSIKTSLLTQWVTDFGVYQHYLVGLLKHRLLGHSSRLSGPAGLEWGLGICISSKSPGDADIVVRGPHLEKLCLNSCSVSMQKSAFLATTKGVICKTFTQELTIILSYTLTCTTYVQIGILNQQIWFSLFSSFI